MCFILDVSVKPFFVFPLLGGCSPLSSELSEMPTKSKHENEEMVEGKFTWLVLKTNFVPLVKLSVTIIRFFREGLYEAA